MIPDLIRIKKQFMPAIRYELFFSLQPIERRDHVGVAQGDLCCAFLCFLALRCASLCFPAIDSLPAKRYYALCSVKQLNYLLKKWLTA